MCNPMLAVAVASLVVGAGSAYVSHDNQNKMAEATEESALASYSVSNALANRRQQQEQEAAAQRRLANDREYAATKATATVAADESGVAGLSVDALLRDLAGQQASRQKAVDSNLSSTVAQLQAEKLGLAAQRDSRINSAFGSSNAALALQIGGAALSAVNTYKTQTDPNWMKPNA